MIFTRIIIKSLAWANGDFMRVDIRDKNNPFVIKKSVFNVGGEIVDVSTTGSRDYNVE